MRRNETQKERAKSLRTHATPAEQKLWTILRAHRFEGVKFTRQVQLGRYILDFAARSMKLAIEVDGDTHSGQVDYHAARTRFVEAQGYRVVRFTNAEVMGNIEGVAAAIATALRDAPLPTLSPEGRGLEHIVAPIAQDVDPSA